MPTVPPRFLPLLPPVPQQGRASVMPAPMFRPLGIAAAGLSAQRMRMEVAAQNNANAETTRTPEGGPWQRKQVVLEAVGGEDPASAFARATEVAMQRAGAQPGRAMANAGGIAAAGAPMAYLPTIPAVAPDDAGGVRVAAIESDPTPGPMVYDPGHPDADASGYVHMPNVDLTSELVELMEARRVYEANASVFQATKQVLRAAINL
ncbi:MAG: flagellar basal body rod protein FlgC [Gemmatimonadaceae bacterium]